MGHRVKAALVQAKKEDGSFVHVYEGGFLPDDQDPVQLEQLVAADMVEEAEPDSGDEDPKPSRGRRSKPAQTE